VSDLVRLNPLAPSSEKYIQYHVEFELLRSGAGYHLRIGINYRGAKVQEVRIRDGMLVGWNAAGQALGRGGNAKMLLAGHTIVERDANEQLMSDSKFSGGRLPDGKYVRTEFKTRGWLGQTRNLDGKQLEKDIDLLKNDGADLLVIVLSEVAYLKWRGEGDEHHAARRTGTGRFAQLFPPLVEVRRDSRRRRKIDFEGQRWTLIQEAVTADVHSVMPDCLHILTLAWR